MRGTKPKYSLSRRRVLQGVFLFLGLVVVLPLLPYVFAADGSPPKENLESLIVVPNPGTDLWRGVRQAQRGVTQVKGLEAGVLVSDTGQWWREMRNDQVRTYGGWALFLVFILIVVYHAVTGGGVRLEHGRSGQTVLRWSLFERTLHWFTATLFLVLALTGLSLLFGRIVLIPLLGLQGFGGFAQVARALHNYLGPFFVLGVLAMLIVWVKDNMPNRTDLQWLAKGGGFFGKGQHPHAGRINAGEKIMTFWGMATIGIVACVTGLILNFPNFEQTRETMQLMMVLHGISTVVWMFLMFGHIYLGALGVEGALDGMVTGHVDVNWAKQHHDLWYEEISQAGHIQQEPPPKVAGEQAPAGG